ncbi:hypothetical protein C3E87_10425 [Tessaracoccus sp. ZS01]|nr:hypothetical protein [Tessaracoccus sp. ZS01]OMG54294.1 hypothetical protein BJN44_10465 [Tessaracoccus sp. ZS01]
MFTAGNEGIERLARTRSWRIVTGEGTLLKLDGVADKVTMPAPSMNILAGALEPAPAARWSSVLSWIRQHVHNPLLVVGPNHPAADLALWANAVLKWPHAAWVEDKTPALTPSALALMTSASGVVHVSQEAGAAFRAQWPAFYQELPSTPVVELPAAPPCPATLREEDHLNVLIVAYYAGPSPTVGTQRPNYWFDRLEELSGGRVVANLAVATPWPDAPAGVHYVPDHGPALVAEKAGGLGPWGRAYLENVNEAAKTVSQDSAFWELALERYFNARNDEFDVVICSGNPFSYFGFARYAKRRWGAATILDYRDPFALNPRMAISDEQRERAANIEVGFNLAADRITVVNSVCSDLVVNPHPGLDPVVINNGWDDRLPVPDFAARHENDESPARLVHAGQFFAITPPDALISALDGSHATLTHFGKPLDSASARTTDNYLNGGRVAKDEILNQFVNADCGVAYSSVNGIETPTKVYDYLAMGLDVLVLYEGARSGRALDDLLADTAGVYWVPNNEPAIREWMASYEPVRHLNPERALKLSRRASTESLIALIEEVGAHRFDVISLEQAV